MSNGLFDGVLLIMSYSDVVVKAWKSALDLATRASGNLLSVMEGSASYKAFWDTTIAECKFAYLKKNPSEMTAASKKQMLNCYRHFLAAHNLAYGQYFGADPENIELSMVPISKALSGARLKII